MLKDLILSFWPKSVLVLLGVILFQATVFAQNNVSGKIISSEDNEPLIGVTVLSLPSGNGVLTDFDGNYSLSTGLDDSLRFSYIGFKTITVAINNQSVINLNLLTDINLVDEVVIIGYGKVKKSDLTGSVSSVKAEELIKIPSSNPLQALQGKVSGLSVLSTSGDPGATPVVRLRGVTTLNDNNPIVVIDGVISDVDAMNMLNANDIASVEVLKDASSTAIYGSRGAAGVIIVSTNRGNTLKNKISVSIDQSFESISRKIDVMDGREFPTYINEIEPGTYNNIDILPNVDWQDLIYQDNAPITNANLSMSGSSGQAKYYLGLGYFGQTGIIPKSGLDRVTSKINTSYELSKNIEVGLDLSIALSAKNNAPGVVAAALRAWPIDEPYLENGDFAEVNGSNPLASIEYTNSKTQRLQGLGNLYAIWKPLRGLSLKTSAQFDFDSFKSKSFVPVYFVAPLQQNETNDLSIAYGNDQTIIWENTANYDITKGKSTIGLLAGYSVQSRENEFLTGITENLLREEESFWYLDAGQNEFEQVFNGSSRQTMLSYLSRFNYSYDSRYLFTATFRRDGSSNFGIENRWGNFPSFALGWNISNESFFPQNGKMNNLKIRASWGKIGNERIPGNAQYSLINQNAAAVFGQNGEVQAGATFFAGGNPLLKWEETAQADFGIEMGFLENKFLAEIDYYVKNTSDILVDLEPIGYTGIGSFQSIFYNAANVRNSGFEWNFSYRDNINKNMNYEIGILGSTVNNEVTNLGETIGAKSDIAGGNLGNGQLVSRTTVGLPIGYFYGYETVGVIQNQAELESSPIAIGQTVGDLKYRDINEDGKIDGLDRTFIGSSIPDLILGFNASVGYKQFSLSADIQGQYGNEIYNGKQAIQFALLNYEDKFNNRWTSEGSTNEHFKASQGGVNFSPSDYFIEDGSFIRLRNLSLTYNLSPNLAKKLRLNTGKIYLRGSNLYTLTRFSGYSPDLGASNATSGVIDLGSYPITRVISVGASIGL